MECKPGAVLSVLIVTKSQPHHNLKRKKKNHLWSFVEFELNL